LSEPKGMMTHPDAEVLAEFRAGLVAGRDGARISAHLADCVRCAGVCDQLAEVSALLAAVPPPALPDPVTQRLETALAAEAANRFSSERAVDPRSRERASTPGPRRRWDFRLVALRVLAPAAAVVVLAAGGFGLSRIGSGPSSSVASGSAAVPAASAASASSAASAAAGRAAAASRAAGLPTSAAGSRTGNLPAVEAPARFGVVISGIDYLRATLARQLEGELGVYGRATGSARELATGPVKGCVLLVTHGIRPGTLVLVETAHFQGQPANVIVAVSGHRDTAWVTTPACSASSHYVLDTTTLAGTSAA
jgi:hypothetical protein